MENDKLFTDTLGNAGFTSEEVTFILEAVMDHANKVNGNAYYLDNQIAIMTAQREALNDDLTALASFSAKMGMVFAKFPAPYTPPMAVPPQAAPTTDGSTTTTEAPAEAPAETPAT